MHRFKAIMFDFDGTVTEPGQYSPPQELADELRSLAGKMPIAFCTGRQLESFMNHGFDSLGFNGDELKNLFLIAENGSIGYHFENGSAEEFYRADWPEDFVSRAKLMEDLVEVVKEFGMVYNNAHQVVVVMRTKIHYSEVRDIEVVNALSKQIFEVVAAYFAREYPGYEEYFHIGDSGIGVVICPAKGDKDNGIQKFAEYLRAKRSLELGNEAREILVIGDSPQVGGNDHYFLNGDYGTPYTVGHLEESNKNLRTVVSIDGKRLMHAEGTLHLLKGL
ncbi:HAD hydrolase family protein [Candidatus Gracilibacteria bacterium]|nr:HAD hydrolase family protein [Candidatus Gracilibacteria bacterium]